MFEIGKKYSFERIVDGQTSHSSYEVADWHPPLVRLVTDDGGSLIVNTSSQTFIQAKPYEPSIYETRGVLSVEI